MKRYIKSSSRNDATRLVYELCDKMNWNYPTFKDKTKNGYKCKWGGRSFVGHYLHDLIESSSSTDDVDALKDQAWKTAEADVNEARRLTGIDCYLNSNGYLIVPFAK